MQFFRLFFKTLGNYTSKVSTKGWITVMEIGNSVNTEKSIVQSSTNTECNQTELSNSTTDIIVFDSENKNRSNQTDISSAISEIRDNENQMILSCFDYKDANNSSNNTIQNNVSDIPNNSTKDGVL